MRWEVVWWGIVRWEVVWWGIERWCGGGQRGGVVGDSEVGLGAAGICGDGNVGAENSCDNCWELVL